MQLNVTSSDTIVYFFPLFTNPPPPLSLSCFLPMSTFLFFLTSALQYRQTVYMKIYSLPWGRSEISREVTCKWQGEESDLIDWPQALYVKIGKAHREEENWFLLGEAHCPLPFFFSLSLSFCFPLLHAFFYCASHAETRSDL